MQIRKFTYICGALCLIGTLLSGCGNNAGTIRQLRHKYAQTTISATQIPSHFGSGVVLGDSRSWIDSKWGQSHVSGTKSKGNATVVYPHNVKVTFTHNRASSIDISTSNMGLKAALAKDKSLLPEDCKLVTHHQATSPSSHKMVYQYQSKKLATLVKSKIWTVGTYEVPGMIYVVLEGNAGFSKINSISIGVQNPHFI